MLTQCQTKQKHYRPAVCWGRSTTLNKINTVCCFSGQLHKIRTAEMKLKGNRFKFRRIQKEAKTHHVSSPEIK